MNLFLPFIALLALFFTQGLAQPVNSIAIIVDDEAITTYDIEQRQKKLKISNKAATDSLILDILKQKLNLYLNKIKE